MSIYNNDSAFSSAQQDYDNQLPEDDCDGDCTECSLDCEDREYSYGEDIEEGEDE